MSDLFQAEPPRPLAERLRPRTFAELAGHAPLLGPGGPIARMLDTGRLQSLLLWGPPGVGKTTLAHLIATRADAEFIALSAVLGGMPAIRDALARTHAAFDRSGRRTLLFIDEIHRLNQPQQNALLPALDAGCALLIGATTENPSFQVSPLLLKRMRVHVLKPLEGEALRTVLHRAQAAAPDAPVLDDATADALIEHADGDARRLLNLLEQLRAAAAARGVAHIDSALAGELLSRTPRRFDKGGDHFYDQISALHKSVRGSNPDAALYWLCRMLDGGAERRYLARRIVAIAWDDIGLADPRGPRLACAAAQASAQLGAPEGDLALAQAVLYLACAPKSNAGGMAFMQARAFVRQDGAPDVPAHLRHRAAPAPGDAAPSTCLPDGMDAPHWYQPTPRGLEARLAERLAERLDRLHTADPDD